MDELDGPPVVHLTEITNRYQWLISFKESPDIFNVVKSNISMSTKLLIGGYLATDKPKILAPCILQRLKAMWNEEGIEYIKQLLPSVPGMECLKLSLQNSYFTHSIPIASNPETRLFLLSEILNGANIPEFIQSKLFVQNELLSDVGTLLLKELPNFNCFDLNTAHWKLYDSCIKDDPLVWKYYGDYICSFVDKIHQTVISWFESKESPIFQYNSKWFHKVNTEIILETMGIYHVAFWAERFYSQLFT